MNKNLKILAVDSMSTFATFDGEVANTFSCNKNYKEYSFYSTMLDICMKGSYDVIVFEETRFQYLNSQKILYGQLALLKTICHPLKTKVETISPKEVKKLFCGNGDATKEDMIAEAKKRGHKVKNDHESDAVGIYYAYKEKNGIS